MRLSDLEDYEATGVATPNLLAWPWELGAPVVDGDGNPDNYNLAGGDGPRLLGHQTLWWVMNDRGNVHERTGGLPIGLEVQVSAFAAGGTSEAVRTSTLYQYRLIYRGEAPLTDAYFGFFVDADLGRFDDDFIGSDTTLGIGFVYNADDDDEGGYGAAPPALGYTFLQGPLATDDARDNDGDGLVDEDGERLKMTSFVFYNNGPCPDTCDPQTAEEYYNYLQGLWRDGVPITEGGNGRDFSDTPTRFHYPGDPQTGAFWSEVNTDGAGTANLPADRRFVMSTGPFTMEPGEEEVITVAIVWGRGSDHLASIGVMKEAAREVREAFEAGFEIAPRPAPVEAPLLVAPADGATGQPRNATLVWQAVPGVDEHEVQVATDEAFTQVIEVSMTSATSYLLEQVAEAGTYYWRVRGVVDGHGGPWSEVWQFGVEDLVLVKGEVLYIDEDTPAFIEVVGPGGIDPCGAGAQDTDGCAEVGGNLVWHSPNSTADYLLSTASSAPGPEERIGLFAPNDFEIRFTAGGSYAYHPFTTGNAIWVPFEVWDIGPTGPFGENDPSDDVRLIPNLFSDNGGECAFDMAEVAEEAAFGFPASDRIYAYYPTTTYEDFEAAVKPLVDADPNGCPNVFDATGGAIEDLIDFGRDRPLQRIVVADYAGDGTPPLPGTVIRFLTTEPPPPPVPAAPRDGAVVAPGTVVLWWNEHPQGAPYTLQVATTPDFAAPIVNETGLTGTSYELSGVQAGSTYYWRVRLPSSDWSPVWSFTVDTATGVEEAGLPRVFALAPVYPNPLREEATIRFDLPHRERVELKVYNVLGQEVATLASGSYAAGRHTVRWRPSSVASGVYYVRMKAGVRQSRSLLVVR